jgi:hypothetical protein
MKIELEIIDSFVTPIKELVDENWGEVIFD